MGRDHCRQSWASVSPGAGPGYQQVHRAAARAAGRGFLGASAAQQFCITDAGSCPSTTAAGAWQVAFAAAKADHFCLGPFAPAGTDAFGSVVHADAKPDDSGNPWPYY